MDFGIAGVAAITVIAYLIGSAVKATALDNKWIPIVCGAAGGILGALAMRIMPDFPATDYITAVAVGMSPASPLRALIRSVSSSVNNDSDKGRGNAPPSLKGA